MSTSSGGLEVPASMSLGAVIDLALAFLRRRWLGIAVCLVVSVALGGAYLYTAKPSYTATATMMLETRKDLILPQSLLGEVPPDATWIESQIGVLKSQSVVAYVVRQLRLADDPGFSYPTSPFEKLLARFGWGTPAPQTDAERTGSAIGTVMSGLEIKRLGPSLLIRIDFRGSNPEQAAKVANAMVDAYIYDQLNAKYQANRRAGDWLQERL